MKFYLTLVSSGTPLSAGHIAEAESLLGTQGHMLAGSPVWLNPHKAADIPVIDKPDPSHIRALRTAFIDDKIDIFVTPEDSRRKKLLVADMDSTIVSGETLDELAAHAGIKDKIAPITARAMRGELDFRQALRERVALLKDLPESAIAQTLQQTTLNPGAEIFVQGMKNAGATCVLVSGGFTYFTETFAQKAGFDAHHGNILEIKDEKLTGQVVEPILDKNSKVDFLTQYMSELGLRPEDTIAIGDGANDLPMLQIAGLGIGYHPKPLLEESLDNCIIHGDLTAALYAQGYTHNDVMKMPA